MKQIFVIGFFAVLAGFFACSFQGDAAIADVPQSKSDAPIEPLKTDKKMPVLVELFTSEGCSSCPPADVNLASLEREQPVAEAEVITLALHVDYWNSLSWKDEYSSPVFSRRQQLYSQALKLDSNYTPQMVVDGRTEFVGSDAAKTRKAILEAVKSPKATVGIEMAADKYKVKISNAPAHENATIFLAVTEDNLASNVRGGENSGRKLEHTSVVRELKSLGMLASEQKSLEFESALQLQPHWKEENLKIVVFVQENASRKIFGVGRLTPTKKN